MVSVVLGLFMAGLIMDTLGLYLAIKFVKVETIEVSKFFYELMICGEKMVTFSIYLGIVILAYDILSRLNILLK